MSFILGKKQKMSQVWKGEDVIPVTVIKAEPNRVSLLRTKDKHGYEAVQLELGKHKREFRTQDPPPKADPPLAESSKLHDSIDVSVLKEGDVVKITATSKGKGFQGVVKRHGFHGGPKSHGQKDRHRAPGSIGVGGVQRVIPGLKMAGRMGGDRITTKNLRVVEVDKENNLILIQGAVQGNRGSLLKIWKTGEKPFPVKEEKLDEDKKGKKGKKGK